LLHGGERAGADQQQTQTRQPNVNWVSFGIHGVPYLFMILVVEFENDAT